MTNEAINWNEIFEYRDGELFWKVKPAQRANVGDAAGSPNGKGHLRVKYRGKGYLVHRIIWEMHCGLIPEGMQIDHANGDRADNRVTNLRLATASQNRCNSCKPKTNTSGHKGVVWRKADSKWTAEIKFSGRKKFLGYFATKEEAYAARIEAERIYHGEFAASESRKLVAYFQGG